MCIDGDNSEHVTEYINAQLHALHKVNEECHHHYSVDNHDELFALPGYDFALAAFYHKQAFSYSNYQFSAKFGAPRVEFVCNHDVLLHLSIHSATLASIPTVSDIPLGSNRFEKSPKAGAVQKPNGRTPEILTLSGMVTLRVPFVRFDLTGHADVLGPGEHTAKAFVLDMAHATVVKTSELSADVTEAFRPYIEAYLKHFQKSGYNILSSLPIFKDNRYNLNMDFSAVTEHVYTHIPEMFNIELNKVATYLQESWRTAAWFVQEKGTSLGTRKTTAIAEWDSTWMHGHQDEYNFMVKFGAPKVAFLCGKEAVIYLQVDEVVFSDSKEKVYRGWQIALVVEVVHSVEAEGAVEILTFKAGKGGKFAQNLSVFVGFDLEDEINYAKFSRLISFLSVEYLQILEEGSMYLYRHDSRAHDAIGTFTGTTSNLDDDVDIATHTTMDGFEQIAILSQFALDQVFSAYHSKHSWMQQASVPGEFSMKYEALRIRLLSNNRVLVFIPIKSGKLRTVRDGKAYAQSEEHQISDWELVFEAGIRMEEGTVFTDGDTYLETKPWSIFKSTKKVKLLQLVLDFETAKFEFGLSRFNDPEFGYSRLSLEKAAAAHHYLRQNYFEKMKKTSARVVHTVILSDDAGQTSAPYDFAKATFHIYSKNPITRENYLIIPPGEEPVIAVLGTVNPATPLPPNNLHWSTRWLYGSGATLGTLALSKSVFLEGKLLPLLEGVNRATTLLPAKLDMDAGDWFVELTTWKKKYNDRVNRAASWELMEKTGSALQYKWDHSDEYEYNHEGRAGDKDSGSHFLSMKTDNRLTIPTHLKAGQMDITMRGTTTFSIGWHRGEENVRYSSSASWTIVISAETSPTGLRIFVNQEFSRTIADETVTGQFASGTKNQLLRPKKMLEEAFPDKVALTDEIKALEQFEGVWSCIYPGLGAYKLGNPFFTEKGDLLVEFCSDSPDATQPIIRSSIGKGRPSTGASRPIITRPSSSYKLKNGSATSSPITPHSAISPLLALPPSPMPAPTTKGGLLDAPVNGGAVPPKEKVNGTAPVTSNPPKKASDAAIGIGIKGGQE
ncbi:hypothetical protein DL93DRAFT_1325415 [Clavulina sp. PMI_390]|nr:hypothetical protein DL93DRAFT_1325415 [Clavulina sp. PMI_390]